MISYDINRLFTNIRVVEVIDICVNVLYYSDLKTPSDARIRVQIMLHMAVFGVEFSFDGK